MSATIWEDLVSLNSHADNEFEVLGPARDYRETDGRLNEWASENLDFESALDRDICPLPETKDREGYYGPHHFSYWASGLRDMRNVMQATERLGVEVQSYFDFGCASGRVIRHFLANYPQMEVIGCDINRRHVEWCTKYLPLKGIVFQSHSLPALPIPDNSLDAVSAFSVFTHIEAFESAWLMELRRILKPGGIAWVTVHTELTLAAMTPGWPLYKALAKHPKYEKMEDKAAMHDDRLVFRWHNDRSYSSNVFYRREYLERTWDRILKIKEFHHRLPVFQDVVVMQKV